MAGPQADIVLATSGLRLTLEDGAASLSLAETHTDRSWDLASAPIADVTVGGRTHAAASAALNGDRLTLRFEGIDTTLTYGIEPSKEWIVLRLQSIKGARPQSVTLLRLPVPADLTVGARLNAAWDAQSTVWLMAATRQVDCQATGRPLSLTASSQDAPGPRLEGSAVALIVTPTGEFRAAARRAAHAFGLLTNEAADGTPAKDTDFARGSYWFLNFSEADVDRVIGYCRQTGFRQVLINYGSWCASPGHYVFNLRRYPGGLNGLKAVVGKLHAEGILVGMHTFVSKVGKTDPYVTPVPDKRFLKDRETVLAEDVSAQQTSLRTDSDLREWPGSPVARQKLWEGGVEKHQEVVLGDEIVQYAGIGPAGHWDTFLGCKRGAWGTRAAAHRRGATGYHYAVDGGINGYIIDQETDLMDEVAERLATIFNACDFDMVYFDGGEDVDRRRFSYYVANCQEQAVQRFTRRPLLHMGTLMPQTLWHSFARSATVDTYPNTLRGMILAGAPPGKRRTVREHIDRSVTRMLAARADMLPGELGWFGIWPRGEGTDGLQLDEIEYLMCKSLGHDAPISLQAGFHQMDTHPLTPEILRIVAAYERLRLGGTVTQDVRARLQEAGADFALLQGEGPPRFVRVQAVPLVGGAHDVRACVGELDGSAVATVWHSQASASLVPALRPGQLEVTDFGGRKIDFRTRDGKPVIPVGPTRTTLRVAGLSAEGLRLALETAETE